MLCAYEPDYKVGKFLMIEETDNTTKGNQRSTAFGPHAAYGPRTAHGPRTADGLLAADGPIAADGPRTADGPIAAYGPRTASALHQGTHVCAQSLSCIQLFATPLGCNPAGSFVHGILQARILEWDAMPSSRGSSRPRDRTRVSCVCLHWQVDSLLLSPHQGTFSSKHLQTLDRM